MSRSYEMPTTQKSTYLLDNHATKVKELLRWIRVCKFIATGLLFVIGINFVLMYSLIFHPPLPTAHQCIRYGFSNDVQNLPRTLDLVISPQVARESLPVPVSTSTELSVEVKTRDSSIQSATSTEIETFLDDRDYKSWFFLGMGVYYGTNQAISWWNMVAACQDFSNASNVINCVWGAVTSVITFAGAVYQTWQTIGRIQTWAGNNGIQLGGFKRDLVTGAVDDELLDAFSNIFSTPVIHLGTFDYAGLGLNGTLAKRESSQPLDVFGFTNPDGIPMHFSFLGHTSDPAATDQTVQKKFLTFKFGIGPGTTVNTTSSRVKGRQSYAQQYFTSGGIDFILDDNQISDQGYLSTSANYPLMYDEVTCYMASTSYGSGHYFQIYDSIHQGTVAGGAVAPFRGSDHWSSISVMYNIPSPVQTWSSCTG